MSYFLSRQWFITHFVVEEALILSSGTGRDNNISPGQTQQSLYSNQTTYCQPFVELCFMFTVYSSSVQHREMQPSVFPFKSHFTSIIAGIIIDLNHLCGHLEWLFYSMVLPQRSDWTSSRGIWVVTRETTQEGQAVLWCDYDMLRSALLEGYGNFFPLLNANHVSCSWKYL